MTDSEEKVQQSFTFWGHGSAEDFDRAFGRNLRAVRESRGMSQRYVVEVINEDYKMSWHQTTLAKTENGERPVRLFEAEALADALGVGLDQINPVSGFVSSEASAQILRARAEELRLVGQQIETRRQGLLKQSEGSLPAEDDDPLTKDFSQ